MSALNYRHLYYFWVVAKEGGMARAAQRLGIAIQTISAQVRELEKSLGHQLFKPLGRGVTLTEAGHAAYARAEEIFQIGQRIAQEVKTVHDLGVEICMVIGGGNIFRGLAGSAQGMERTTADYMGMLATVMNALAIDRKSVV